jgi:hypothetical protein
MAAKKQKTVRVIAAELGMSLGQINEAKKAGIDAHDVKALRKFKAGIPPRVDSRSEYSSPSKPGPSSEMTLDEIERALMAKGISVAEATTLKRQLEGLKLAAAVRKEMNQLLSRDEVGQRDIRIGAAVSAALRVMESEIPQLCLGLPLERSRPLVKERIRAIQGQLADGLSQFWAEHPEQ